MDNGCQFFDDFQDELEKNFAVYTTDKNPVLWFGCVQYFTEGTIVF